MDKKVKIELGPEHESGLVITLKEGASAYIIHGGETLVITMGQKGKDRRRVQFKGPKSFLVLRAK